MTGSIDFKGTSSKDMRKGNRRKRQLIQRDEKIKDLGEISILG